MTRLGARVGGEIFISLLSFEFGLVAKRAAGLSALHAALHCWSSQFHWLATSTTLTTTDYYILQYYEMKNEKDAIVEMDATSQSRAKVGACE